MRVLSVKLSNAGEGHLQIGVHELRALRGPAAGSDSQRLLHVGRGEPEVRQWQVSPQREQLLLPQLAGPLLARPLLRQLRSH